MTLTTPDVPHVPAGPSPTGAGPAGVVRGAEGLPRVAAAIGVTVWTLVVAACVMLVAARPPVGEGLLFFAVDVSVGAVYGSTAAVVLARRRHPVPWLLALAGVGGALAALGFAWLVLDAARGGLPLTGVLGPLQSLAWVPGTLALFLVVPWLVREHPLGAARWGVAAGTAVTVAFVAAQLAGADAALPYLVVALVVVGLAAAADAAWRGVRGPVAERVGLGWLATGTAVMALSFAPLASPSLLGLPWWTVPSMHLAAQTVFPAAVLVAVLRQRMWGLDLAVSRAVVAGTLTVGLVVLYVAVAAALAPLAPGSGAVQVVAAAAVAVAVQPSRLWLQRRVHRLVHGDAREPERAVRRLGSHLGTARTADELLGGLAENLGTALRLESVRIEGADGVPPAGWGTPTSAPVAQPLEHRGERVGALSVTVPPGESLDTRARRTLGELSAVVAAGVALARATSDLEEARERLTSVRLEERRRIRRELHDGLGPALAGIRLGLQGARNLVTADPAAAAGLLAALQSEVEQRVDDVRHLSRSLLPPALDELGLGPALEELAARHRDAGLAVELRCGPTSGLPAPVAAAVYGIVSEALTNVARHARASHATVAVDVGEAVVLEVTDDGRGVASDAAPGVGTTSMRERAAEQGGTVEVGPRAPHGTRVAARIPVRAA